MTFGEMTTTHFFRSAGQWRETCNKTCRNLLLIVVGWLAGLLGKRLVDREATVLPAGWVMANPAVANEIGINKAIIFQTIDGWVQHNRRHNKNIKKCRAWSYNTIPDWGKVFCWLNANYVGKLIRELEDEGRLVSAKLAKHASDQTKYYSTAAGSMPESDPQQMSLWPVENMTLRGRKVPHDSSIGTAKANPSIQKVKTTTPTTRVRVPMSVGAVAEFPNHIPKIELAEKKPEIPEGRPESDEHEQFIPTGFPSVTATDQKVPIPGVYPPPPIPRAPSPSDDESTEVETASSGNTPPVDIPEWMPSFFTGCTANELVQILHLFGEDTLQSARKYAENPKKRIDNPAGYVRAMLAKGWQPPKSQERSYLSGWGMRGEDYITGAYADFIEH